jgi:hypothetical protein
MLYPLLVLADPAIGRPVMTTHVSIEVVLINDVTQVLQYPVCRGNGRTNPRLKSKAKGSAEIKR